jgi:hypothetical protein
LCLFSLHAHIRKRASAEIGVVLNGDYNSKPKTSKNLKQDAVENMQPDNAHEKESTAQEPKTEASAVPDLKNLASSNVHQSHEVETYLPFFFVQYPACSLITLNFVLFRLVPASNAMLRIA